MALLGGDTDGVGGAVEKVGSTAAGGAGGAVETVAVGLSGAALSVSNVGAIAGMA